MKKTKQILSVFLALIMIISIIPMSSITVSAAEISGTCGDNLIWNYDDSTYTLTISGTGAMTDYSSSNQPWEDYEDSIKTVVIEDGATTIGRNSFYHFGSLISVTIPDSVTSIGNYAFAYCGSLTSITIPDSVTTIGNNVFYYCSDLLNAKIGEGVKKIGESAFSYCGSLIKITIPDSVITINANAFYDCANLTKVTIGESVTTISDYAFYSCKNLTNVTIGNSVTSIGQSAFSYCTSLKNVTIPNSVTSIGEEAFQSCTSFTSITISSSVMSIGNSAFNNCTGLTSVTIENGVMTIGSGAFRRCTGLTDITIPNSVISIGVGAFNTCSSLTDVYYLGTEEEWNEIVIGNTNEPLLSSTIHFIYDEEHVCSYDDGVVTTAPTCTNDGVKTYTCIDCGNKYTEVISATGTHIYATEIERENPTCTADGYVTMLCGCGATEITTLSATGHTSKTITISATCTVSGIEYNVCEICGETLGTSTVISATGHALMDAVEENYVAPTCTTAGSKDVVVYCSVCDVEVSRETETIDALGHTSKTIIVPATCTVAGMEYVVCEICGETIGTPTVLPATGHTLMDAAEENYVAPTCITEGSKDVVVYCSVCDAEVSRETKTINALGHTAGEWETVLEPTYEADGKKVQKCTACGEIVAEEAIPMLVKIVVTDEETDISIEVKGDEYNGEVDIVVEESFDGTAFDVIDTTLDASQKFIYDITMTVDGVVTQPTGTVTVRIPLPEGYDPNRSFVYYVNTETGTVEKMPASYEDGYMVFETTHFSYYAIIEEYNYTFSIQTPSTTTIRHKDGIKLHTNIEGTAPAGSYVEWTASNGNFKTEEINDGNSLKIVSDSNGTTTFTATLYSAEGEVLATDSIEMKSKAGFFDKIGSFFRSLFGGTKIYEY